MKLMISVSSSGQNLPLILRVRPKLNLKILLVEEMCPLICPLWVKKVTNGTPKPGGIGI
jgi:hypothetical protein